MWIRSQDLAILVKANEICIENKTNIRAEGSLIGEYSTEEKAMRVMDMIQKQIAFCSESYEIVRPVLKSDNFEPYWKKREVVFNMPEDTKI